MLKKLTSATLALASILSIAAASIPAPAEAGSGRFAAGVATGIIGLGVLGAIANAHEPPPRVYYRSRGGCYPGPEECGWRDRHCFENSWGDMVCRGGRWTCWRPTYCD